MTRQTHANHSLGQRRGQYKQDCVVGLLVKIFRRLDAGMCQLSKNGVESLDSLQHYSRKQTTTTN